ncbi:hypothetical protein BBO_07896 [Beauveria brongniartii RCEF 3172]|uniref:Uncharacterized protein n=1 Tax=Beauveria brongniartii RCEF 3172 TaxID=1081107 RepID=A0A166YHU4_9HYPO|nr:hypothetical protein BBO_07896 [Beauveria brongniartii RCEF 3172]
MFAANSAISAQSPSSVAPEYISKVVISAFVTLYSVYNFFLVILSARAWKVTQSSAAEQDWALCQIGLLPYCSASHANLYGFIMMAAIAATLTSGLIAARLILQRPSIPVDFNWVFRGIFFTLLLFAPPLYLGWTVPSDLSPFFSTMLPAIFMALGDFRDSNEAHNITGIIDWVGDPALASSILNSQRAGGIVGAFVIEAGIDGSKAVNSAIYMFHFTVFMGIIFAGVICALAPTIGNTVGGM